MTTYAEPPTLAMLNTHARPPSGPGIVGGPGVGGGMDGGTDRNLAASTPAKPSMTLPPIRGNPTRPPSAGTNETYPNDNHLIREFQGLVREQDLRRDLERIQDRNEVLDRERRLLQEQARERERIIEKMQDRDANWQREFANQQLVISDLKATLAQEVEARRSLESQITQLMEAVRVQQEALVAAKTHVDTSAAAFNTRLREVETALVVDGRALADAVRMRAVSTSTESAMLRKQFADLQTTMEQRLGMAETETRELRRENTQLKGELDSLYSSFSQIAMRAGFAPPPRPFSTGTPGSQQAGELVLANPLGPGLLPPSRTPSAVDETDLRIMESRISAMQDTIQSLLVFKTNMESRIPEATWLQNQLQDTTAQQRDHIEARSADLRASIDALRRRVEVAEQQCAKAVQESTETAQRLQHQLRMQVEAALDQVKRATLDATRDVASAVEKVSESIRGEVRTSRVATETAMQALAQATDQALTRLEDLRREFDAMMKSGDERMSELETVLRAEVSTRTRTQAETHSWVVASQAALAEQLTLARSSTVTEVLHLQDRIADIEAALCLDRVVSMVTNALEEEHVDKIIGVVEGQNSALLTASIRQKQAAQLAQQEAREKQKQLEEAERRRAEREEDLARQEKALQAQAAEIANAFRKELRQLEVQRAETDKQKDRTAARTQDTIIALQVRSVMDSLLSQVELISLKWEEAVTTDRILEHVAASSRETLELAEEAIRAESARVLRAADSAIDVVLQRMESQASESDLQSQVRLAMESMLLRIEQRAERAQDSAGLRDEIKRLASEAKQQIGAQAITTASAVSGAASLAQEALDIAKAAQTATKATNKTIEEKLNSLSQNLGDALSVSTTESRRETRALSEKLAKVDERLLKFDVRLEELDSRTENMGQITEDPEFKKLSTRVDEVVNFTKQFETDLSEAVLSVQEDLNQQSQYARDEITRLNEKLTSLEDQASKSKAQLDKDLKQGLDSLSQRIDGVLELVDEHTTKTMQLTESVKGLGIEVKELHEQTKQLDQRIEAIEQPPDLNDEHDAAPRIQALEQPPDLNDEHDAAQRIQANEQLPDLNDEHDAAPQAEQQP